MDDRQKLFETLRKIALYVGAATSGERDAAASARERIRARLKSVAAQERSEEYRFSMDNPWSRKIFVTLLRRYGIEPYRYSRQRRTTVMARVPRSFVEQTLMPEFEAMNRALTAHLERMTDEILSQEVANDTSEAREVAVGVTTVMASSRGAAKCVNGRQGCGLRTGILIGHLPPGSCN